MANTPPGTHTIPSESNSFELTPPRYPRRPLSTRGRDQRTEADTGLTEKAFRLADAAGHRAVGVRHPVALGVLSGKQEAAAERVLPYRPYRRLPAVTREKHHVRQARRAPEGLVEP